MSNFSAFGFMMFGALAGFFLGVFAAAATPIWGRMWQEYRHSKETRRNTQEMLSKLADKIADHAAAKYQASKKEQA